MPRKNDIAQSFDFSQTRRPGGLNPYAIVGFFLIGVVLYSFISYGTETAKQKNDEYCEENEFNYYGNEMKNVGGQKAISCCELIIENKIIINETCSFVIYDVNQSDSLFGGFVK